MKAEKKKGQLFIVATPIGNLQEITYRAVETMKNVDFILCEDTRHSLKLLNHLEIKKPLISYHKFNEQKTGDEVISELKKGKTAALISDAGMPGICDPGWRLIQKCLESGIDYTVISGASALINALVLSGLNTDRFYFAGFLPEKNKDRKKLIRETARLECTVIFYASPHSLQADLDFLYSELGARKVSIIKEISKAFESVERTVLGEPVKTEIKGEFVIVSEGAAETQSLADKTTVQEQLDILISMGTDVKEAVKIVAKERCLQKNEVYQLTVKKPPQ